ncbi:MAG: dihydrolipoyl dehydrogenase [Oligoflexus sp.]|nr:dihydrolipoyl dehydrogenase [Oligoflexus sp.]
MLKQVDVAIIGAGTAGLTAVKELKKTTKSFLIIDRGPLGTTCSRVGCMPSKALLQFAHEYAGLKRLQKNEIWNGQGAIDIQRVMKEVRKLRDHFVAFALKDIEDLGDHFLQGHARFIGPNHLKIDDKTEVKAKSVIIATGGCPNVPKEWASLGNKIVTTDSFFELDDLPESWAVVGMGPIGLEIGQAMALLDRKVYGFDKSLKIAGLADAVVAEVALKSLREDFPIHLGEEVKLSLSSDESKVVVRFGSKSETVEKILVATGRKPNLEGLGIDQAGCLLTDKGLPRFNKNSMKVEGVNPQLYVAGDFDGDKAILHEAADEGRMAGFNALRDVPVAFKRKTPMSVTFTIPNIASIGLPCHEVPETVIGEVSFSNQGRSKIMGENKGALRLYVEPKTGKIMGAELMAPEGEHLAHILAAAITEGLSVQDMLRHTFYHPTVEEGLRTALRDASRKLALPALEGPDMLRI